MHYPVKKEHYLEEEELNDFLIEIPSFTFDKIIIPETQSYLKKP
jgi:hypothetical protein